jgi:hypothetical protein
MQRRGFVQILKLPTRVGDLWVHYPNAARARTALLPVSVTSTYPRSEPE